MAKIRRGLTRFRALPIFGPRGTDSPWRGGASHWPELAEHTSLTNPPPLSRIPLWTREADLAQESLPVQGGKWMSLPRIVLARSKVEPGSLHSNGFIHFWRGIVASTNS